MLAIEEAKLPPPKPAVPATSEEHPERHLGVLDDPGQAERRHEEEQGRDDGPVAAAEDRHREGVGDAEDGTDTRGARPAR